MDFGKESQEPCQKVGGSLSILYVKRRQDINDPGIGEHGLERVSGCPREHLEFHLWYLKAKGWIARLENGTLASPSKGSIGLILSAVVRPPPNY
jgi:hypothetical protein